MWGKVKIHVMKYPIALQAQSSIQAHSKHLRIICKDRNIGTWEAVNANVKDSSSLRLH